ncbi:hypothetical protein Hypma_003487 [Hypsizygus marmoreus]|uniref:Uncharacterized protein n=1 Tax=Hypsizygus marmoreus TaxID=39966 RepID=A0A369J3Q5_HYPMA|nr:hypothetical protein Hypma_003487 [Hypsizygus marmoreus]
MRPRGIAASSLFWTTSKHPKLCDGKMRHCFLRCFWGLLLRRCTVKYCMDLDLRTLSGIVGKLLKGWLPLEYGILGTYISCMCIPKHRFCLSTVYD